jgi:hypothetical protein
MSEFNFILARFFRAFLFFNGSEMSKRPFLKRDTMSRTFNPDATRQNDPGYWAAAAVVADQAGDDERASLARQQLQRLGYRVEPTLPLALSANVKRGCDDK